MHWNIAEAKQKSSDVVHHEARRSLADDFAELRQICADENYDLSAPPRQDRTNPFADASHVAG